MIITLEYDRLGNYTGRSDQDCYDDDAAELLLYIFEKGYDRVSVSMDLTTHDLRLYY